MRSSTSPALVERSRLRLPLRWVVRSSLRSYRPAPIDLGGLELDQLLEDERHRLAQDVGAAAGADRVEQAGKGRL